MIAATLFSGIGAPEAAMPHWRWAWSAEIEKFPAAVLTARHPHSVNLGDVTAHDFAERAAAVARPDVLVFGSPCQSFSVAGRRLGLDDPRGNLALVALGIIARLEPRWFVFENVPGLLSSAEGRDFGLLLRAVDEIGYSFVWAVLDAQHFGVAQRRERVFAVGYLGDWRYPAAVLLEPESLCGNPPACEQARQDVAGAIGAGSKRSGGRVGRREAAAGHIVADPLTASFAKHHGASGGKDSQPRNHVVSHALRADGFDASEDGTGRGTPLVAHTLNAHGGATGRIDFESETFVCGTLNANGKAAGSATQQDAESGMLVYQCHGTNVGEMGTLRKGDGGVTSGVPFTISENSDGFAWEGEVSASLQARTENGGNNQFNGVRTMSGVRRLMPVECERLQGFPDGYTAITYRGKPAADGPRYKALGNSMAVPVPRWILQRIEYLSNNTEELNR